ncbi:hypothetical protein Daus18300_013109 [Diaporthe australafricana]|uniref:Uncharacterized protein n=1 Tax=Diaporthe australafricana TaxID=127596 RepID=A0ABR3W0C8_9PEZI
MSSTRHRDRSRSTSRASGRRDRSPPRATPGQSSSQRDDYDRDDQYGYGDGYRQLRYNDGNRYRDDTRPQGGEIFTGQKPTMYINYNYGDSSQMGFHGRRGDDRKCDEDRGRSQRPRSQSSPPPRGSIPPPTSNAPLNSRTSSNRRQQSRARPERPSNRDGSTPKGTPKEIPQKLRTKCGSCRKDHDIRYCPYPNTDDLRTKICPICDTTKHAWFQCEHYKDDASEQFDICWVNRRGLPTLVHDNSLHEVFVSKLSLKDHGHDTDADCLRSLNYRAGPLGPQFVKRLMPPEHKDGTVADQLNKGQKLPWDLDKETLESPVNRPNQMIEDPATRNMRPGHYTHGTKTTVIPKARALEYFLKLKQEERDRKRTQDETAQNTLDFSKGLAGRNSAAPSSKKTFTIRSSASRCPADKWGKGGGDRMDIVACANCGNMGRAWISTTAALMVTGA